MLLKKGVLNLSKYSAVGKRLPRKDAFNVVTGAALYGVDISLPGMLYGKILFSKIAHGRIKKINTKKAENLPGVRSVITHKDFPDVVTGTKNDKPLFSRNKIYHKGDRIAAVAADSLEIAEKAISLIDVEYETLPVLLDPDDSIKDDSPVIHEDVNPPEWSPIKKNVCAFYTIKKGNVDEAFKKSDIIVEDFFETSMVHQGYLEPHAAVAQVNNLDEVTVWSSTQTPFGLRSELSDSLGIPLNKIRFIHTYTGGGFGGKLSLTVEPACVVLSQKTGRAVKITLTREEELISTNPRVTVKFHLKSGLNKKGKIIARKVKSFVDAGAYAGSATGVGRMSVDLGVGPYNIENVDSESYVVYTNKMSCGAFRAPGSPQASFASESHTDHCAKKVGIDPLDFRLNNVWVNGSYSHTGQKLEGIGLKDSLEQIEKDSDWNNISLAKNQGKGVAIGMWMTAGSLEGGAWVKMNEDGSVSVVTGACDSGSGATWGGLPMIASEELGVPLDKISIYIADTANTPFDAAADGSRTTYCTGNAVKDAAIQVRNKLFESASKHLDCNSNDLEIYDGVIRIKNNVDNNVPISVLAAESKTAGGQFLGGASYVFPSPEYDKSTVGGDMTSGSFIAPTFAVQVAVVEVDEETGLVKTIRYVATQDVGFAVNPIGVEGQIEGGAVQGLGQALMEKVVYGEEGETLNPNLLDYKMPTALDVPYIESSYVEGNFADGPYGSKGVGEPPIVPPPAAIGNAIYHATGIRIRKLPLDPETVSSAFMSK